SGCPAGGWAIARPPARARGLVPVWASVPGPGLPRARWLGWLEAFAAARPPSWTNYEGPGQAMTAGQAMTEKAPARGGRAHPSRQQRVVGCRGKLCARDGYDEEPAPASALSSPEEPVL